jgi:hypothetical protein
MKRTLLTLVLTAGANLTIAAQASEFSPEPTPSPAPTTQVPIIINNYIISGQPAPQPTPQPAPEVPSYVQTPAAPHPWDFVTSVWSSFSNHNISTITSLCQDGVTNYFGRRFASLASISNDMSKDRQQYGEWRATYYPETYWREVSQQYSRYWQGPLIYDHIDMYSEVYEYGVRWHRARVRFVVGFTNVGGVVRVYSLTYQPLYN